jgi:hypothetical protein
MDRGTELLGEARALVARLRADLLRPGDLPARYRRWLMIGRAEARRHRRETGERFEQSPSRQVLSASAAVARREGLCAADADDATALRAFLRSFDPGIVSIVARPARPPSEVRSTINRPAPETRTWQPQAHRPPL